MLIFSLLPVVTRHVICQVPLAKIVRAQPLVFDDWQLWWLAVNSVGCQQKVGEPGQPRRSTSSVVPCLHDNRMNMILLWVQLISSCCCLHFFTPFSVTRLSLEAEQNKNVTGYNFQFGWKVWAGKHNEEIQCGAPEQGIESLTRVVYYVEKQHGYGLFYTTSEKVGLLYLIAPRRSV